jgi:hypothetical protein
MLSLLSFCDIIRTKSSRKDTYGMMQNMTVQLGTGEDSKKTWNSLKMKSKRKEGKYLTCFYPLSRINGNNARRRKR